MSFPTLQMVEHRKISICVYLSSVAGAGLGTRYWECTEFSLPGLIMVPPIL